MLEGSFKNKPVVSLLFKKYDEFKIVFRCRMLDFIEFKDNMVILFMTLFFNSLYMVMLDKVVIRFLINFIV